MNLFFSMQQQRNIFKVGAAYGISKVLIITFLIAVPSTFADEEKEISNTVLNNSVAVLPFENLSPNPNDAYFAVGIHEEIIDHLAKLHDMSVISRNSVLRYEGSDKSIHEIANELNVETIMKGSVRYADNQITLTVRLFDVATINQLWSERYERVLSDIFAIQAEIVEHIALALGAEISTAEQERIEKVPTQSLEAYVLYLKTKDIPSIIGENKPDIYYQILDQAIEQDSDFALAHAFKARGYALAKRTIRPIGGLALDEMERAALEHAEIALNLDPHIGLAYMAQAEIHRSHGRGTEGRQAFDRALESNPNDMKILSGYARFLTAFGEHDEAAKVSRRVLELAPNVATNHYLLGGRLMYARKPAEAADQFRLAIAIKPRFTSYLNLCSAEFLLGNKAKALEAIRHAEQLIDDNITTRGIARVAYAYSRLGLQEDARRLYNLLEEKVANGKVIGADISSISYLAIGEVEKAYDVLSKNPNEGSVPIQELKFNMLNDPILDEPRFEELRKIMGS